MADLIRRVPKQVQRCVRARPRPAPRPVLLAFFPSKRAGPLWQHPCAFHECERQQTMSRVHSAWIDHPPAGAERLDYGGPLEVVSFVTLVAMIALAAISVAAV